MVRIGFVAIALLQVLCVVHLLRSRRPSHWFWLILLVPPFGCIAYFVLEVLPELRRSGSVHRITNNLVEFVRPGKALKELEEEVAISDTFSNRQRLARGFLDARRYQEAIGQYQRCLQGSFRDDGGVMLELAYACYLDGDHLRAQETLERLAASRPSYRVGQRQLLLARSLEEAGDLERAMEVYQGAVRGSAGEEMRCRYALLLERAAQPERARAVYQEILTNARRSPRFYRRSNDEWIRTAKRRFPRVKPGTPV